MDFSLPLDIRTLQKLLPHRYPFLLIDRVLAFEVNKSLTAIKNVTVNEPFFQGHFPDFPVMPGVLIIEAMAQAGVDMGLTREQAHQLSVATFAGAAELARRSDEPPQVLRQRVTSKGGTTHAAIESMEADGVAQRFMRALDAAEARARELGEELGR